MLSENITREYQTPGLDELSAPLLLRTFNVTPDVAPEFNVRLRRLERNEPRNRQN